MESAATVAVSTPATFSTNTLRTLPRKRRPRAVGEVSITCPSSCVYLNADTKEEDEECNRMEPVYENTCLTELKQKIEESQRRQEATKETSTRPQLARRRIHLTFIRATISEVDDETREGMVMSTFVGW